MSITDTLLSWLHLAAPDIKELMESPDFCPLPDNGE